MKIYEIIDEENKISVGNLLYYEKANSYVVELQEYLDKWSAPLLFAHYVEYKIYTMPRDVSYTWAKERVIPSGRQNISSILQNHKMTKYNEMRFLELSHGRCSQDSCYIKKIDEIPDYIKERMRKNLVEVTALDERRLLCFFADDTTKVVEVSSLLEREDFWELPKSNLLVDKDDIERIIRNRQLYESVEITPGGYALTFNDSIDISATVLYEEGENVSLGLHDIQQFVKQNLIDTSEACEILECSRQNIAYLTSGEKLSPLKENTKGNLYMNGDIVKNLW